MAETFANGRYRIGGVLGTGAFATVFDAYDERFGIGVALKVLAENHSLDPDMRERFITEGHLLRRIDSQHVVHVFDLAETERGQPFLVLEQADRGDLAARLAKLRADGYRPAADDMIHLATVLAAALDAVHAANVVHRDLSPGNILIRSTATPSAASPCAIVGPGERLLLADLGLSKDLAAASGLTVGAGTSGFTPPEQRGGGRPIDARADLWAAGALLVWLALGRPPDDGGTWQRELAGGGWPQGFVAVLATSLSADPAGRYSTPAQWRDAVTGALALPSAAPVMSLSDTAPPARRRRVLLAAVAVVVAAVAGFVGARLTEPDSAASPTAVEELSGGRLRASRSDGDLRAEITGPAEVNVGETVQFEADVDGEASRIWIAPDGQLHFSDSVEVTANGSGTATIRLIATSDDGRSVDVALDFEVRDG